MDQESLQLIRKLHIPIIPNITDTFHNLLRDHHRFLGQHYNF
jgi:hypothetical protein